MESKKKHDIYDSHGFNVSPELLAHDLTILKMAKTIDFENLREREIYDIYTQMLDKFEIEIESRIERDH